MPTLLNDVRSTISSSNDASSRNNPRFELCNISKKTKKSSDLLYKNRSVRIKKKKEHGHSRGVTKQKKYSNRLSTSPHRPKLDDEARANILFQAHLTTTSRKAPKNFSPKVIRTAALCSPRHFMEEQASLKSINDAINKVDMYNSRKKVNMGRGITEKNYNNDFDKNRKKNLVKTTYRSDVRQVKVTKKKKSMLATVKARAPTVEILTRKKEKAKDLQLKTQEYDRKYETVKQKEKKAFVAWLDNLGNKPNPGSVPMNKQHRKAIQKAVKQTGLTKERAVTRNQLLALFNAFLKAGAGQYAFVDLATDCSFAPVNNNDGILDLLPFTIIIRHCV